MTSPTPEELDEWMREHNVGTFYWESFNLWSAWQNENGLAAAMGDAVDKYESKLQSLHALAKAKGLPWKWEVPG